MDSQTLFEELLGRHIIEETIGFVRASSAVGFSIELGQVSRQRSRANVVGWVSIVGQVARSRRWPRVTFDHTSFDAETFLQERAWEVQAKVTQSVKIRGAIEYSREIWASTSRAFLYRNRGVGPLVANRTFHCAPE